MKNDKPSLGFYINFFGILFVLYVITPEISFNPDNCYKVEFEVKEWNDGDRTSYTVKTYFIDKSLIDFKKCINSTYFESVTAQQLDEHVSKMKHYALNVYPEQARLKEENKEQVKDKINEITN